MDTHEGLIATVLRAIAAFLLILALLGIPLAVVSLAGEFPVIAAAFAVAGGMIAIRAIVVRVNYHGDPRHAKRPPDAP
jgi:hypothetical protein